jgi:hypothetical protein
VTRGCGSASPGEFAGRTGTSGRRAAGWSYGWLVLGSLERGPGGVQRVDFLAEFAKSGVDGVDDVLGRFHRLDARDVYGATLDRARWAGLLEVMVEPPAECDERA